MRRYTFGSSSPKPAVARSVSRNPSAAPLVNMRWSAYWRNRPSSSSCSSGSTCTTASSAPWAGSSTAVTRWPRAHTSVRSTSAGRVAGTSSPFSRSETQGSSGVPSTRICLKRLRSLHAGAPGATCVTSNVRSSRTVKILGSSAAWTVSSTAAQRLSDVSTMTLFALPQADGATSEQPASNDSTIGIATLTIFIGMKSLVSMTDAGFAAQLNHGPWAWQRR